MKRITVKITSLILAMAVVMAAVSCSAFGKSNSQLPALEFTEFPSKPYDADVVHPVRKPGKLKGQAASDELSAIERDYIIHDVGDNYLNASWSFSDLNAAGIKISKPTFGTVGPGDFKAECEYLTGLLERLYKIDFEKLDEQDRDFYDQIVFDLEEERYVKQYQGYGYMLPSFDCNGVGSFYLNLSYLDIRNKSEADLFMELLKDTDRYFDAVCEYEEKRSEKGYASIEGFYTKSSTSFYMLTQKSRTEPFRQTIKEKIDSLNDMSEEEKSAFMAKFDKVMEEVMFPEFNECHKRFAELAKTTTNTKGLAGLEHGKEMYEHLLRKQIGRDCNVSELAKELDRAMALKPAGANAAAEGSSNREKMEEMEKKAFRYFPEIKINYQIERLPESFRAVGIGGIYAARHYDDPSVETIFLPEFVRNESVIYHEGIPGHMYQFNYHKTKLRHKYLLLKYKDAYVEGWATYIMENPASMYGRKEDKELSYSGSNLNYYMIQARADICLNYEGLSEAETSKYLSDVMKDSVVIKSDDIVMSPGIGISYGLGGYLTVKTLESIRALDPDMDVLTMHTLYLDAGPGCFDRIYSSVKRKYKKQ